MLALPLVEWLFWSPLVLSSLSSVIVRQKDHMHNPCKCLASHQLLLLVSFKAPFLKLLLQLLKRMLFHLLPATPRRSSKIHIHTLEISTRCSCTPSFLSIPQSIQSTLLIQTMLPIHHSSTTLLVVTPVNTIIHSSCGRTVSIMIWRDNGIMNLNTSTVSSNKNRITWTRTQ